MLARFHHSASIPSSKGEGPAVQKVCAPTWTRNISATCCNFTTQCPFRPNASLLDPNVLHLSLRVGETPSLNCLVRTAFRKSFIASTVLWTPRSQRHDTSCHNNTGQDLKYDVLKKTCKIIIGNMILVGGMYTYPSEKYESQLGWWHPQYVGK